MSEDKDNVTKLDEARRAMSRPRPPKNENPLEGLDPAGHFNGVYAGDWLEHADELGLPPSCPVTPLGFDDDSFYFVNARGTLSVLTPNASGRGHIDALFTPYTEFAAWAWPKTNKGGKPTGNYDADQVRKGVFAAASRAGGWNAVEKVRGRGAWKGEDGGLILHLGNQVWAGGEYVEPSAIDGYLYPIRPRMDGPQNAEMNAAHDLLQLLSSWRWARPELDPELVLGWIVAAMIGGALERRPIIYVTGDKGTGKTTLQDLVGFVLGRGIIKTSDTTRAGIDQAIKSDSIPVMVDEMEAKADPRRAQSILELARTAYDGALTLRGGADHNGREFRARSCFWFSSINPPAMEPQDRSRMGVIELLPFAPNAKEPAFDAGLLGAIGQTLLHRCIEWWPRFPALLDAIRTALKDAGHDGRGATTWGILAACAHMARHDVMPDEDELKFWKDQLNPTELAEFEAMTPDWRNCVDHMMATAPRLFDKNPKGQRTVAGVIMEWKTDLNADPMGPATDVANEYLALLGMKLIVPKTGGHEDTELFVSNSHSGAAELFAGKHWGSMAGGSSVWTSALRKMPSEWRRTGRARISGMMQRGTMFRLKNIMMWKAEDGVE